MKLKHLLCFVLSFFIFIMTCNAESSHFSAFYEMDTAINEDNTINVILGYTGEQVMAVNQTLSYDSSKLDLIDVVALDNFVVTVSDEKINGKYHTLNVLADSEYSFNETNYCIAVFELKNGFKVSDTADIFLYNVESSGPELYKYRTPGDLVTIIRDNFNEVHFTIEELSDSVKYRYTIKKYMWLILLIGMTLIFGIISFFLIPSKRKKESRENSISNQIKSENYKKESKMSYKIDTEAIDSINNPKKPINIEDAIIVNEDVKPFGDSASRFDYFKESTNSNNELNTNGLNAFAMDAPNKDDDSRENPQDVVLKEIEDEEDTQKPSLQRIAVNSIGLEDENVELLDTDDVEMPELNNKKEDNKDTINNLFILFILITSCVFMSNVFAQDYNVSDLRSCLVGNIKCSLDLDYNSDGKVDLLDLMATKNLENINFETLLETDTGFKELHSSNNNIVRRKPGYKRTTKKVGGGLFNKKNSGSNKNNGGSGSNQGGNSSIGGDSDFNLTATTTTAYVEPNTTSTTNINVPVHKVNISLTNADYKGSKNFSFNLSEGDSKTIGIVPDTGYELKTSGGSCSNISFSLDPTSSHVITFSNVKGDASCSFKLDKRGNIKVELEEKVCNLGLNSCTGRIVTSTTGTVGNPWNVNYNPPSGFEVDKVTCGNYDNKSGKFNINIPSYSITCTLRSIPKSYDITAGSRKFKVYYKEKTKLSIKSSVEGRVECDYGIVENIGMDIVYEDIPIHGEMVNQKFYNYNFYYTLDSDHAPTCVVK